MNNRTLLLSAVSVYRFLRVVVISLQDAIDVLRPRNVVRKLLIGCVCGELSGVMVYDRISVPNLLIILLRLPLASKLNIVRCPFPGG